MGSYIAEGGNNFWGVEVHKHPNGQKYVLASDRDSGVWIFQYNPSAEGGRSARQAVAARLAATACA